MLEEFTHTVVREEESMDRKMRNCIEQLAKEVRDAFGIRIPITNIDEIVQKLNGTLTSEDSFDDLCDGTIRKKNDGFEIRLSPYQSPERRTFTIAHELGHLFLHMGYCIDKERWEAQDGHAYCRFGTSEQEYQANEFAACLLMPKNLYADILDEFTQDDNVDIASVAKYFHVSTAAATNRGKFLGYIE